MRMVQCGCGKDKDNKSLMKNEVVLSDISNGLDDKVDQIVIQRTEMGCCLLINYQ